MSDELEVTPESLRLWPLPMPGSDKHSRGVVLVVAGSTSTPGAAVLASEAALRVGAGKLRVMTADHVAGQVAVALPEARVTGLRVTDAGDPDPSGAEEIAEAAGQSGAVLLGPGWTDPGNSAELCDGVVPRLHRPFVLDALATAYVTSQPEALRAHEGRCVVTANPTEVARMLGHEGDDVVPTQPAAARELAARTRCVVLCGAEQKYVAVPDGTVYVVTAGNRGLGVSGSGDVQAGLVAGLLARGCDPTAAAVWGGYLHGAAGDAVAARLGRVGYLARELPPVVPGLLTDAERL